MKPIEKYLEFLVDTLIKDAAGFDHVSMYFIIPAIFYIVFLLLKYAVLTSIVWIPITAVLKAFKLITIFKK